MGLGMLSVYRVFPRPQGILRRPAGRITASLVARNTSLASPVFVRVPVPGRALVKWVNRPAAGAGPRGKSTKIDALSKKERKVLHSHGGFVSVTPIHIT
jgi:hypothetical protein